MAPEIPAAPSPESRTLWPTIVKRTAPGGVAPNVGDYDRACAGFSWDEARRWLDGLPGGRGLNIAHEAIDRQQRAHVPRRVALRWISRTGERRDFTYDDLRRATNRFANVLGRLGVGKGDVVATLAGRIPGLYVAALGALKNGSVYSPLFSAFGPDPIVSRMTIARTRVLVTTDVLYRRKVEPVRAQMPALEHVLLVRETAAPLPPATVDFNELARRRERRLHDSSHRSAGPRAAALHERHHRKAEGRDARPRGRRRALRHGAASRSTSIPTIASGARPIRAGSPARPTASSRRSRTA